MIGSMTEQATCTKCYGMTDVDVLDDLGHCFDCQEIIQKSDPGQHYRYTYRVQLTEADKNRGYVDVKLDPFRIARIYSMTCFALQTILKKCLKAGGRGYKDERQDLHDIISAAERKLEMMREDERGA